MYKWDAGEALQLIERERPKQWTGVPTMVQDLMEHPGEFKMYFQI
jgi:long-chain acyl-CoA synthetase